VVYLLSNKTDAAKDITLDDDNPIVEIESREEDVDFSLEKFRSFVNNNEEMVIGKIIKWMRNDDV
jgi:hypothetical protein